MVVSFYKMLTLLLNARIINHVKYGKYDIKDSIYKLCLASLRIHQCITLELELYLISLVRGPLSVESTFKANVWIVYRILVYHTIVFTK